LCSTIINLLNEKKYKEVFECTNLKNNEIRYYLDALVYGNFSTSYEASLQVVGLDNTHWKYGLHSLKELAKENSPWVNFLFYEKKGSLATYAIPEDPFLKEQYLFAINIELFKNKYPALVKLWDLSWRPSTPYPFKGKKVIPKVKTKKIVLFLETIEHDFSSLKGHDVIILFSDKESLWQQLQFSGFVDYCVTSSPALFILNHYWIPQQMTQSIYWKDSYESLFFENNMLIKEMLATQWNHPLEESSLANQLLIEQQSCSWEKHYLRRGKETLLASSLKQDADRWWSPYPSSIYTQLDKELDQQIVKKTSKDLPKSFDKINVVHIVHRVVDQGYAPTTRISKLLQSYDLNKYSVTLIVLDTGAYRPRSYPFYFDEDDHSELRGVKILALLKKKGIKIWVDHKKTTLKALVENVVRLMVVWGTQISIYHDFSAVSQLIASLSTVPIKIGFVHGIVPHRKLFDYLLIPFKEEEKHLNSNQKVIVNRLEINFSCKKNNRKCKGKTLVTVSNMPDVRLNWRFCKSVAQIIKNVPDAIYVIIGDVLYPNLILQKFDYFGVKEHIVFTGYLDSPFTYLQQMDLYLNEFPIGGGLATLEAISVGLPVVALYDRSGTYKSREGANYFGIEKAASSEKEYVSLATTLLQHQDLYNEWINYTQQRYKLFCDEQRYYDRHQKLLEELWGKEKINA
jgi:glycosyltransferase involved in cell wall biosynthesis